MKEHLPFTMSSSNETKHIFDKIWFKFDSNHNGFIYGKDLLNFIREMILLTSDDSNSKINDNTAISEDKITLVENFVKENEFLKIYKITIDDFLNSLIGMSFSDFIVKYGIQSINKTFESNNNDNNKNKNNYNNNTDIENKKDENADNYKEKYEFLKREYEFYKKTHSQREINNWDETNNSIESFNYNFLLKEFKNQINEQTILIEKLNGQIDSREPNTTVFSHINDSQQFSNNNSGKRVNDKNAYNLSMIRKVPIRKTCLIFCTLIIILLLFNYLLLRNEQELINSNIGAEYVHWWENIPVLNNAITYCEEFYYDQIDNPSKSSSSSMSNEQIENYNKIFGIS